MLLGVMASAALVWHSSRAAFTAQTTNPANAWAAGSVALSDDDTGAAQFSAAGIVPGQSQQHCIAVTYGGSVQAAVTLYATASSGALRPYLNLTVEEGRGGGFGSCTGFVPASLDYAGTVADFATTRTDFTSGAGFFAPTGAAQTKTYRFTTTLDAATPDSAQAATASLDLQWQARSAAPLAMLATRVSGSPNSFTRTGNGITDWTAVRGGNTNTCAIRSTRTLWCWGSNSNGQLGDGTTVDKANPQQVGTDTDWSSVAQGNLYVCAIKTTGTLWCWGRNINGVLGLGDTTDRLVPTQVGSATNWRLIEAKRDHTCGIRTDGTLWCWGNNGSGQVGNGGNGAQLSPGQVGAATDWQSVTAAGVHTCALKTDQSLWCWGANNVGQLGLGSIGGAYVSPTRIGSSRWASIAAGFSMTCGIQVDATLWCWGQNVNGELGQGDTTDRPGPTRVGVATDWRQLDVGGGTLGGFVCAVRNDRSLWCWGYNGSGQLGDGTTTNSTVPKQISTAIRQISLGGYTSAALSWPT